MDVERAERRRIIGLMLRETRLRTSLSQATLARRLDRPQSFVSKYEQGERTLDLFELDAICSALDLDVVDFVRAWRSTTRA